MSYLSMEDTRSHSIKKNKQTTKNIKKGIKTDIHCEGNGMCTAVLCKMVENSVKTNYPSIIPSRISS